MSRAFMKALIVDDEPLARRKIRALLAADPDVQVVAECAGGEQAISSINEMRPDLVFLDVQMPEVNGFDVLAAVASDRMPVVIFVTAYDQYCLQAFEYSALDYLLKPVDRKRFRVSLDRAKSRINSNRQSGLAAEAAVILENWKTRPAYLERIAIKTSGRVLLARTDQIDWIEAQGKYVRVHISGQSHLLRDGMAALESQLDPRKFLRIHRSVIVNLDRIRELEPWFHNEYRVVLADGTRLMLSRTCKKKLAELLGNLI
jgi:two-component system LytT family response regulator